MSHIGSLSGNSSTKRRSTRPPRSGLVLRHTPLYFICTEWSVTHFPRSSQACSNAPQLRITRSLQMLNRTDTFPIPDRTIWQKRGCLIRVIKFSPDRQRSELICSSTEAPPCLSFCRAILNTTLMPCCVNIEEIFDDFLSGSETITQRCRETILTSTQKPRLLLFEREP